MYPKELTKDVCIDGMSFDSENIRKAYNLASRSHEGQIRKSGEPYFNHCVEVVKILRNEWGIEKEEYLIAGLLHDSVEDTSVTLEFIRKEFGEEVADLVEGVTKLEEGTDHETLAKVLSKTYLNPGVAILKLADRLHNMRTLGFMKPEKQIEKATETMDVYTKLAESLGMWQVKVELEDLCFQYIDRDEYDKSKQQIDGDRRNDPLFINFVESDIERLMAENNFDAVIEQKRNGYWALKRKQKKMAMVGECSPDNFLEINDVVSFRIKTKRVEDCYQFLRIIHENWGGQVDYKRYDEFIGANRPINRYEAIQTTINFPQGPVEVAIMTEEMEDFNNWGVVSLIKRGEPDLKDYVLKMIFTPSGSLRFMPREATGVDFAGLINPRLLAEAKSVVIDGKRRSLSTVLPNSSTVEVEVGPTRRAPREKIEDYCLPTTRAVILGQRMLEKRDRLIEKGRAIMEEILSSRGLLEFGDLGEAVNPILYNFGCQGVYDLLSLIGNGSLKASEVEKALDKAGITKEKLGLTTIRLIGEDHPKILIDVVQTISDTGANIVRISQKNRDNIFNLRILVSGLSQEQEELLKNGLNNNNKFQETRVV